MDPRTFPDSICPSVSSTTTTVSYIHWLVLNLFLISSPRRVIHLPSINSPKFWWFRYPRLISYETPHFLYLHAFNQSIRLTSIVVLVNRLELCAPDHNYWLPLPYLSVASGVRRHDPDDDAVPDADDRVEAEISEAEILEGIRGLRYRRSDDDAEETITRPIRHYLHSPNIKLNIWLSGITLTTVACVLGLAVGHLRGKLITILLACSNNIKLRSYRYKYAYREYMYTVCC